MIHVQHITQQYNMIYSSLSNKHRKKMTDDGKHFARRLRAFGILPLRRHTGRDKFCKFSSPFIYEI